MSALSDRLAELAPRHREALEWFESRRDTVIDWPDPLNGILLMVKPKGIRVPEGWPYAISVRETLGSPYADSDPVFAADGSWTYRYHQEVDKKSEERDSFHTNRALMACWSDEVPVAVLIQTRAKPTAKYRVLGLAQVTDWSAGYFHLAGFRPDGLPSPTGQSASVADAQYQPLDSTDARRKINAQIVARQGGRKFRQAALDQYKGRCVISRCAVEAVLEAAHIVPYLNVGTNVPDNGLLLRGDLHTLFDRHRLRIDPKTMRVILDEELAASVDYGAFVDLPLVVPLGVDRKLLRRRLVERARLFGY